MSKKTAIKGSKEVHFLLAMYKQNSHRMINHL